MDDRDPDVLGLRDYLAVLRRQRWAILATTIVVVMVALVVTLVQEPIYEASVKIAVQPPNEGSDLERILFGATALGTQQEILTSTALVRAVLEEHDLPTEESDVESFLDKNVTVHAMDNTTVLRVTVSAQQARLAADVAQSMAESYLAYLERDAGERTKEAAADLDTAEKTTRSELRSVEEQLAGSPGSTRESLEEQRDQLYARLRWIATRRVEFETANAFMRRGEIIQPAFVPDRPAAPRPLRTGVLALALGGMLGVGLAFLRDHLDDVVRDVGAVRASGADPVLAAVPAAAAIGEPVVSTAPIGDAADSYRRLRAQLLAWLRSTGQMGLRTMVAPAATEGDAGVVAVNLALSLARSGRRVALIDADLGRATASGLIGVSGPGLTELLGGRAAASEVVTRASDLEVVPAGTGDPQAAEKLASSRLGQLLETLAGDVDDVVLVTRSVESGADALDVAAHGCSVVLVAQPRVTTRTELRRAAEQLHQIGAVVVGTVLADTSDSPAGRLAAGAVDGGAGDERPAASSATVSTR